MSTVDETQPPRERRVLYVVVAVVVVALVVLGLIFYRSGEQTRDAEAKADQLVAALDAAGARTPSQDQVMRVLADDGGAVCANPNDALSRSVYLAQLANGATGPGSRPVIADSRVVQGQLLIMGIYCPDELAEFRQFADRLTTDDLTTP
ncbi:hypothetical protein [Krasilnikoviella flava]|uniref:Uncharacterized protein n=1 Tax=Krasilnikoviella flava TaxID=526729 RepID=A0A1T5KT11_9MICO|nr:hypothetical protein [Krasilnikoviella flava]SKC66615.1 hypothetical protein SAMN04324258_2344 [Krasilnikoviella flava]